jgi:hypothetical protein
MHTGHNHGKVDASDEVGDDQRPHDNCRIHLTESRGGQFLPRWGGEESAGLSTYLACRSRIRRNLAPRSPGFRDSHTKLPIQWERPTKLRGTDDR